jgi:hypothetical protein
LWAPVESRWITLRRVANVLVMLACRRCGAPFFVCQKDYRGQAYCSDPCRAAARVVSARAARRQHERSDLGRLDHRDRQRAYRMRLRARVTDHASPVVPSPRKLSPLRSEPAHRAHVRVGLPRCARCGCESAWARWAPLPGTRIRARPRVQWGQAATIPRLARPSLARDGPSRVAGAGSTHELRACVTLP